MDAATAHERLLVALQGIAPEADVRNLRPDLPLRQQIDLDSLDWLTLADRVGEVLGVSLSGARLGPRTTLDDWVRAAARAVQRRAASPGAPALRRRALRTSVHRLADGRRVRLRPVVEGDAPLLADFVRGLSLESRYRRFMVSLRELPPSKLKSLTAVDPARHVAIAATEVGRRKRAWIGVARCVADAEGRGGEFAVTVGDAWQGTGLAGVLMRALMVEARARGLSTMRGEVLASNRPMLALARQLGFEVKRRADDAESLEVARAL